MEDAKLKILRSVALVTTGVGLIYLFGNRKHIFRSVRKLCLPLGHKHIEVVESLDECHKVVNTLKQHCRSFGVLGFDCEWVTVNGHRRPVAMLQLASQQGLCALFRLCCLQQIPKGLRDLLEDENVIKVGVGSQEDAQKLCHDYGVGVANSLDLRYLAAISGHKGEGLAKMAHKLLNIRLEKNWRVACSDWEARDLTEKQLNYAAEDALVAVELFKKMSHDLEPKPFWDFRRTRFKYVFERLEPFFDSAYKEGIAKMLLSAENGTHFASFAKGKRKGSGAPKKDQQTRSYSASTRSKPLYDNCLLQAPDGELLTTMDYRKAMWYINKELGVEVSQDPFTVRLKFEPAGRPVGDVGRFYQIPKLNRCVVCGREDAVLRKNVVPQEYRKHFPEVMKTHSCHDILLMCLNCHQISNISDLKMRRILAEKCDAPFQLGERSVKTFEVQDLKKLRSACRALLYQGDSIPQEAKSKLEQVVREHFNIEGDIPKEKLEQGAHINYKIENDLYCNHGSQVVSRFQEEFGGLIALERMWREHFLHTMKPKFMPDLWSVNHNEDRLQIRSDEGRLKEEDKILAGLKEQENSEEQARA